MPYASMTGASNNVSSAVQGRHRKCGRRGSDEAERRWFAPLVHRIDHRSMDGRDRRVPGRALFVHDVDDRSCVEAGSAHDTSSARERGEQSSNQPVNVEQRHHVQASVVGLEIERRGHVLCRRIEVSVAQRYELRPARGSGRVQKQRGVVARCTGSVIGICRCRFAGERQGFDPGPELQDRHAELSGHITRRRADRRAEHEQRRVEI